MNPRMSESESDALTSLATPQQCYIYIVGAEIILNERGQFVNRRYRQSKPAGGLNDDHARHLGG